MATPRRVIGTFYALTGLFNLSASLIWGVNTLFLLDAGLSIQQAFAANAAFTAGQVLFEVPTGVVADTRGRRMSFLLACVTLILGTAAYVWLAETGASFWSWAAASVLLGLGFTFYSGAVEAWFVDALAAAGGPEDLDPYFARGAQVFSAAMLVGTVSGGLLGDIDLSAPYIARTALLVVLLLAGFLFMHDQGFTARPFRLRKVPAEVRAIAAASWEHGWKRGSVRLLMLLSFLHMGFLIWGWYAWQPYFLDLLGRPDAIWIAGLIAAAVSGLMILGNQLVRMLHGRLTRPTIILIGSIGLPFAMIGTGLAPGFWTALASFLAGMVFFGIVQPAKQAAFHRLIPSNERATIVSFDGLLGSAGGVGSQLALGRLAQTQGYGQGYLLGGAFLLLGVPLAVAFRRRRPALPGAAER